MYRLLSLFDYSGKWSNPFANKGWGVIQWDIKLADFMDIMALESAEICLDMFGDVHGILSAPPCTDFTVSGAQYWPLKDDDGRTWKSLEFVRQVQRLANLFRPTDPEYNEPFFWALENPVGRLPKLIPELGAPVYFNPFEFAGYTNPTAQEISQLDKIRFKNGYGVSDTEMELVLKTNAYTKKTGLWGEFNSDLIRKPITPVKAAAQGTFTQRKGGKSDATKEFRSNTPEGFAYAFCEANYNYKCYLDDEGEFID
jgi:hypothetical protein